MAYSYETRMISARLYTESFQRCARLGISINAAANYGLGVLVKAHQRNQLYAYGFSPSFFTMKDAATGKKTQATTLRIRHDYLDYIEMQGLIRNKMLNYAVVHVCSMIENYQLSPSAISEGPVGRGIAYKNVYTNSSIPGKEGPEP